MTASQKPKTPSMTMNVCKGIPRATVDEFCKKASRLTLSQVVDSVTVTETMILNGDARRRQYTVQIMFFPRNEFKSEYDIGPSEILTAFATRFPLILKKEIILEMKKLDADLKTQIAELGKGKKSTEVARDGGDGDGDGDDDDAPANKDGGDDEKSDADDEDAEDTKRVRRRKEQASYESDGDRHEETDAEDEPDVLMDVDMPMTGEGPQPHEHKEDLEKEIGSVSIYFQKNLPQATAFTFDESTCTFQLEVRHDFVLQYTQDD
jgi:hypothetical protein